MIFRALFIHSLSFLLATMCIFAKINEKFFFAFFRANFFTFDIQKIAFLTPLYLSIFCYQLSYVHIHTLMFICMRKFAYGKRHSPDICRSCWRNYYPCHIKNLRFIWKQQCMQVKLHIEKKTSHALNHDADVFLAIYFYSFGHWPLTYKFISWLTTISIYFILFGSCLSVIFIWVFMNEAYGK